MDYHSIELMSKALSYLESVPYSLQDPEYKSIVISIAKYLILNCKHEVIEDHIDTSSESSMKILYCKHCMQTFH